MSARLVSLALAAGLSMACSKARAGAPATLQRLELASADVARAPESEEPAFAPARFEPPPGIAPWTVEPGEGHYEPNGDGEFAGSVRILGKTLRSVRIPCSLAPQRVNRVRVALQLHGRSSLQVSLWRSGERVVTSSPVTVPRAVEVSWVEAMLPQAASTEDGGPFDEIVLEMRPRGGAWLLHAVETARIDPAATYPQPGEARAMGFLSHDGRRSVALRSGAPLNASWSAPRRAELRFSYGLPRTTDVDRSKARMIVELSDTSGERQAHALSFPRPGTWASGKLELKAFDESVSAHFRMESTSPEAFCLVEQPDVVVPNPKAPTVLLVTSDTHRADHLASLGQVGVRTPHLDALAARGVLFEHCWSTTNVTVPSHVTLMSGVHPRETGIVDNFGSITPDAPMIAKHFAAAGYRTLALSSARHLDHRRIGMGVGFDRFSESPVAHQPAAKTIDKLLEWLEDSQGVPVFVWLHLFDAHAPYEPPEPFASDYAEDIPESRSIERQRALYRGEISYLDHELGRALQHPRIEDALVAFTSDHGESLGAHDVYFLHAELYPDTLRVPLVLAWPGAPRGTRVGSPVTHLDLGRTLLDLAGLRSAPFPGGSLLDHLDRPAVDAPAPQFFLSSGALSAAVLEDPHLLVFHLVEHDGPGKRGRRYARHEVELFDLADDPGAERDLASERKPQARRLRALLLDWLDAPRDRSLASGRDTSEDRVAELAGLGYGGAATDVQAVEATFVDADCDCAECAKLAP